MIRIDYTIQGNFVRTRWVEETENSSSKCGELILPKDEFFLMKQNIEVYSCFKFVEK